MQVTSTEMIVRTVPCAADIKFHRFPNPCCPGDGCCPKGVAKRLPSQKVSWKKDTPLVLVVPQVALYRYTRPAAKHHAKLQWTSDIRGAFPYVICPACSVVTADAVCAVPTNMGMEASFYLSFIVSNYHRLPRSVAFCHGHGEVQNEKKFTIVNRLTKLLPHVQEDLFIWYGEGGVAPRKKGLLPSNVTTWEHRDVNQVNGSNRDNIWQQIWVPFACESEAAWYPRTHQIGSHFVVGRNRILRRPLSFYKELLIFATGQKWYPGAQYWFADSVRSVTYGPGHQASAAFWLEPLWTKVFSLPPGDIPDPAADGLTCRLKFNNYCSQNAKKLKAQLAKSASSAEQSR